MEPIQVPMPRQPPIPAPIVPMQPARGQNVQPMQVMQPIQAQLLPQPVMPAPVQGMQPQVSVPNPQEDLAKQLKDTQQQMVAMLNEIKTLKQDKSPASTGNSSPRRASSPPVMQKKITKENKHITAMADAEFQQLRAKYEEACIARNIKDKDGNRIPTWKDGLAGAVPVIFRPYCEWAAMIKNNLEQKGFFAPYNKAVGYEVMTEIAKNFGPSFYKIIPEEAMYNLQKTLKFLGDFDKPASSILQLPPMGAIEIKPSITYRWR